MPHTKLLKISSFQDKEHFISSLSHNIPTRSTHHLTMSSEFTDSFTQPGDDSVPTTGSTRPFDDDGYLGYDPRLPSQRFDSFSATQFVDSESLKDSATDSPIFHSSAADDVFAAQSVPEAQSPPSIYAESNGQDFDGGFGGSDGPILPPPSEMEREEGFALREWRR